MSHHPLRSRSPVAFSNSPYIAAFQSAASMSAPFKIDEGYSEETRSQNGSDAAVRADSRDSELPDQEITPICPLPDWVLGLSEADRSGMTFVSTLTWPSLTKLMR